MKNINSEQTNDKLKICTKNKNNSLARKKKTQNKKQIKEEKKQ